jgi:hypothetical protein
MSTMWTTVRTTFACFALILACPEAMSSRAAAQPAAAPGPARVIHVPGEMPTVQAAIDAAVDGDTVLVAPGTYRENLVLAKTITLASLYHTTGDAAYIGQTILDGGGGSFVISVDGCVGPATTVVGFTLQNANEGVTTNGGFNLLNNRITNTSDGVACESCRIVARGNVLEGNQDDGFDSDGTSAATVEGNIIRNNGDDGIEIRLHPYEGPTLKITFRNNIISGHPEDGIQMIDHAGPSSRVFYIEGNLIQGNAMVGLGMMGDGNGAEDFSGAAIPDPIYLTNNTFVGNDHAVTGGANVRARNNIFAGATRLGVKNVAGESTITHSLFWGNGTDHQASNVDPSTSVSADPLFDAEHGVPPGSPAIDAGDNAACPPTDRRGMPRPQDGNGDAVVVCDLGAYEAPRPQACMPAVTGR